MSNGDSFAVRDGAAKEHWAERLREFLPAFLDAHPVLGGVWRTGALLLYGSITRGIEDIWSDFDVWLVLADAAASEIQAAGQDFVEFKAQGRAGHVSVHGRRELTDRVQACEMDLIYQLRHGAVVLESGREGSELIALARRPMRPAVRDALVLHHYVEMRSEHRACDNPMARGHDVAVLLSLTKMIAQTLRTAMVLQGEPYPYDKWLYHAAAATPVGRELTPLVDRVVDQLQPALLRHAEHDRTHPLGREVKALRNELVRLIRAHGIDGGWLTHWYLHMTEASKALRGLRWQEDA